jgi:hypothetical protein
VLWGGRGEKRGGHGLGSSLISRGILHRKPLEVCPSSFARIILLLLSLRGCELGFWLSCESCCMGTVLTHDAFIAEMLLLSIVPHDAAWMFLPASKRSGTAFLLLFLMCVPLAIGLPFRLCLLSGRGEGLWKSWEAWQLMSSIQPCRKSN